MQLYHPQPKYVDNGPFAPQRPSQCARASQAAGLRYQYKVDSMLTLHCSMWGYELKSGQWIQYFDGAGRLSYCQPDFIILDHNKKTVIVVECKLTHTRECVPQLRRYRSLIALLHPGYSISCVEVCKRFDAAEYYMPLLETLSPHTADVAAYLWKP